MSEVASVIERLLGTNDEERGAARASAREAWTCLGLGVLGLRSFAVWGCSGAGDDVVSSHGRSAAGAGVRPMADQIRAALLIRSGRWSNWWRRQANGRSNPSAVEDWGGTA